MLLGKIPHPLFDTLSQKLQETFDQLGRRGRLTEKDIEQGLRAIRMALLEADVNYKVVKEFITAVRTQAISTEVQQSLTPGQQIVQIVNRELVRLLGVAAPLTFSGQAPHVLALVGLQGAGKTTMAAKLAVHLRRKGHAPLLVAADIQRPAAITQLETLGHQVGVPVYSDVESKSVLKIVNSALASAKERALTVVILDTAGRLQIDDQMMGQLEEIQEQVKPVETLLVVDAMTGQEAVNVAEGFHQSIPLTGVIMTKTDGDARGGAALSLRKGTGIPIKFLGTSEHMDGLETFQPEGVARRILGMGDMLALIEKAESMVDSEEAERLVQKLAGEGLNFEDFLIQMRSMKKMGSLMDLFKLAPGAQRLTQDIDEEELNLKLAQSEAIISSMTLQERRVPKLLNGSRKKRIAKGSGTTVEEVNRLLKEFRQSQKMMKRMGFLGKNRRSIGSRQLHNIFETLGR